MRADAEAKANVAVWTLPKMGPKDQQTFGLTLSKAGTAADNVRGTVRWTKPVVKPGPIDSITSHRRLFPHQPRSVRRRTV